MPSATQVSRETCEQEREDKSRRERPRLSKCVGENRKLETRLGCFACCLSHLKVPRLEVGRALRRPRGPSPSSQGCALEGVDFTSALSHSLPKPISQICFPLRLSLSRSFHCFSRRLAASGSCNNSGCSPLVPVSWWRLSLYDAPLQGRVAPHA